MYHQIISNKDTNQHFHITEPGKHIYLCLNYSGTLQFYLEKEGAEVYVFGIYVGNKSKQFEVKTTQHHQVPKTTSHVFFKGVFFDLSKFVYKGYIQIEKNAQKSFAYQKNQNLLLSNDAIAISQPDLEICADDVHATHGSTTGKLSDDELWYVYSRGFSVAQAHRVLIQGFLKEVEDMYLSQLGESMAQREKVMLEKIYNLAV